MATKLRIRVELPDDPGSLARVSGVIGDLGGNVASIDVHEVDGARAVDELVVHVPETWDRPTLARELGHRADAVLLSSRPEQSSVDNVVRALDLARRVATGRVATGRVATRDAELDGLADAIREMCSAVAVWVCEAARAEALPAGRTALARGGPVVCRNETTPETYALRLPPSVWLLAVPDARESPRAVAFAARPLSLRFTATEVARVEALMALARELDAA
jgi:hypothetical protein